MDYNYPSCRVSEYGIVCSVLCDYNLKSPHNSYLTQVFLLKMNSNVSLHKIQILMLIRKKVLSRAQFSLKYSKNCFFATVNQSSYTPNSTKNPCDLSSRTNIPFMGPYIYIYNIYQTFSCKIHFLNIKQLERKKKPVALQRCIKKCKPFLRIKNEFRLKRGKKIYFTISAQYASDTLFFLKKKVEGT